MLLLDKPQGVSSNGALQTARRLFNAAKAGHTGTLDPMASGLLPLTFGEATKFSQMLLDADKTYEAVVQLGVDTDSGDADGAVIATRPVAVDRAALEAVLARFRGEIEQVPPMYSALKRDGKALYEYARAGIELEREARKVTIHALELLDFAGERFTIRVHCSKGTYIRSLAMDIGAALGCGAHLAALRRTAIGAFDLSGAVTLEALEVAAEGARDAPAGPGRCAGGGLPGAAARRRGGARPAAGAHARARGGAARRRRCAPTGPRASSGSAQWQDDGRLAARRLIATGSPGNDASA